MTQWNKFGVNLLQGGWGAGPDCKRGLIKEKNVYEAKSSTAELVLIFLIYIVPEYDIVFPKHADKRGRQISSHRAKREIEEKGLKYYHLTAFDKDLHLNVSFNKHLLGPAFHIETRHKDGSRTITDAPHRNFYHGDVVNHPGSFVALSDNNGVVRYDLITIQFHCIAYGIYI